MKQLALTNKVAPLRQFARTRVTLPTAPLTRDAIHQLQDAAQRVPYLSESLSTPMKGPEPAGATVDFINVDPETPPQVHMLHCAMLLVQGLLHDLGLPAASACYWSPPSASSVEFIVWFDLGDHKLVVFPSFSLHDRTMSMQLAHVIWLHQGWMTGHDPRKQEHWNDLSTHYDTYFYRPGHAYAEATEAYHQKRFYWGFVRDFYDKALGTLFGKFTDWGRGEIVFTTAGYATGRLLRSENFKSFMHFEVGEPLFPLGSPAGVILQRVRTFMAEKSRDWRHAYGPITEIMALPSSSTQASLPSAGSRPALPPSGMPPLLEDGAARKSRRIEEQD
jgi:hypothetical protein